MRKFTAFLLLLFIVLSLFSACSDAETASVKESSGISESSVNSSAQSAASEMSELTVLSSDSEKPDVKLIPSDSWESEGKYFRKYSFSLKNTAKEEVSSWSIELNIPENGNITDCWNCETKNKGDTIIFTPADYNSEMEAGQSLSDIGFILSLDSETELNEYKAVFTYSASGAVTVSSQSSAEEESENSEASAAPAVAPAANSDKEFPGKLHVEKNYLADADNKRVQLKGVSTHGLAWFPQYVNIDAFRTLRDDWGANAVRLAMYTAEPGGYCTDGNKEALKKLVHSGVSYASELDMYVIIDWHILSDFDPNINADEAENFFNEVSKKYADNDHVLYEICNEPQNSPWSTVIKPYAERILSVIRKNDPDAVVIVGTNTWSQDVSEVSGDMLEDENVMYALHFYAATHKEDLRAKAQQALDAGVPIFVSECSICDASGNGGIDYDSAKAWLDFMNDNGLSFMAWSLSNKNESASLIAPDCDKLSSWADSELSETGKWYKKAILG